MSLQCCPRFSLLPSLFPKTPHTHPNMYSTLEDVIIISIVSLSALLTRFFSPIVDISSGFFHLSSPNARLMNAALSTHRSTPLMKCAQYCQMKDMCQSYNHVASSQWCELNYERAGGFNGKLQSEDGANYYEKIEL